nr:ATP synthase F0 subunit 8 [Nelidina sp. n.]
MPQMAPMWWTLMFSLNIVMMFTSLSMLYFMFLNNMKIKNVKKINSLKWTW